MTTGGSILPGKAAVETVQIGTNLYKTNKLESF